MRHILILVATLTLHAGCTQHKEYRPAFQPDVHMRSDTYDPNFTTPFPRPEDCAIDPNLKHCGGD
jgi:hypothetical protein